MGPNSQAASSYLASTVQCTAAQRPIEDQSTPVNASNDADREDSAPGLKPAKRHKKRLASNVDKLRLSDDQHDRFETIQFSARDRYLAVAAQSASTHPVSAHKDRNDAVGTDERPPLANAGLVDAGHVGARVIATLCGLPHRTLAT